MLMDLLAVGVMLAVWLVAVACAMRFAGSLSAPRTTTHPSAVADPWPVVATTREAAAAEPTNVDPIMYRPVDNADPTYTMAGIHVVRFLAGRS